MDELIEYKASLLNANYKRSEEMLGFMQSFAPSQAKRTFNPHLDFEAAEQKELNRVATEVKDAETKVLADCDHWRNIMDVLELSKEQIQFCEKDLIPMIEQGLNHMKLPCNNN